jgi:hypothetical protein
MKMVPVVAEDGTPLDPCHPARARELVKRGRAVRRFAASGFYIQMRARSITSISSAGVSATGGRHA